jgi:hypothetical protein
MPYLTETEYQHKIDMAIKQDDRIAELEAYLAEAVEVIRGIRVVAFPYGNTPTKADVIAYKRMQEFLKKLEAHAE